MMKTTIAAALLVVAASTGVFAQTQSPSKSTWADSPEATFLTNEERAEWFTLETDAEREAFKNRYWLQRDPTPDNDRLEFKEIVEKRIATADQRFPIATTPGSQTARGMVFILLGSPSVAKDSMAERNAPGQPTDSSIGLVEGNEYTATWKYDLLRTPAILNAIDRPTLDVTFVIEPSRRRDQLQSPGLIEEIREKLAQKSIINPIALSTVRKLDMTVEPMPGPALTADTAAQLDKAAAEGSLPVHSATFWTADGSPVTTIWFVAPHPAPAAATKLAGRVRDAAGKDVASILRDVRTAGGFKVSGGDSVVIATRLALPPGSYDTTFLAQQPGLNKPLATAAGRFVVPERSASDATLSSLVLTDTIGGGDAQGALSFGKTPLQPRADSSFATSESLWYAFQVASPAPPEGLKLAVVLRKRDGTSVQASPLPVDLSPAGPGLYAAAFEMPLASVAPGEYSLYLTATDAAGHEQVRRADFKVMGAPVR